MIIYKQNDVEMIFDRSAKINNKSIEIIERKGWGHPDKLADDLAEILSRNYSLYSLKKFGFILHHNFDKLCILGGKSIVKYGYGELLEPIRILVNGRISTSFKNETIALDDLIINTCKTFFKSRLPLLNFEKDIQVIMNLNSNSSPGYVVGSGHDNKRCRWFTPLSVDDLPEIKELFSNDTSFGTGYAPMTQAEKIVKDLVDYLSFRPRQNCPEWMGTDVKVMACRTNNKIDVVACVPQIAVYTKSRTEYERNIRWLKEDCLRFIKNNYSNVNANIDFNTRDKIDCDEIYLTAIGSSIESGDEGVVGRGNRINGLITPMRPMNLEGANGKNPVYHVGKLYNILANNIACELHLQFGGSVIVNLISKTGKDLRKPWKVIIQMENSIPTKEIFDIVENKLSRVSDLTIRIVYGHEHLS